MGAIDQMRADIQRQYEANAAAQRAASYGQGYNMHGQQVATASQGNAVHEQAGDTTMVKNRQATISYMDALNPETVALQNAMLRAYMSGSGEFGLGAGMKQANATMGQYAARAGIPVGSGAYASALSKMYGQALGQDAMARQQYGMQLMQASPAYYNSMQLALGKQQNPGFGEFAGNILGTGVGALTGGYGNALGAKLGG